MKIATGMLAVTVLCGAASAADVPATAPAGAKPDYSSPENTLRTFAAACAALDREAMAACCYNSSDTAKAFCDSFTDYTVTGLKFFAAVKKHFNEDLGEASVVVKNIENAIAGGPAKIDGDQAELTGGARGNSFLFKKINGEWKLDMTRIFRLEDEKVGPRIMEESRNWDRRVKALKQLMAEIEAKKFATYEELQARTKELLNAGSASKPGN